MMQHGQVSAVSINHFNLTPIQSNIFDRLRQSMGKMMPQNASSLSQFHQPNDKMMSGVQVLKAVSRFRKQKPGEVYNPLASLNEDSDDDYSQHQRFSVSQSAKRSGFRKSGIVISNHVSSERITGNYEDLQRKPGTSNAGARQSLIKQKLALSIVKRKQITRLARELDGVLTKDELEEASIMQ